MADELYAAGKLAREWGVSPKDVKAAIDKTGVDKDANKGACCYYTAETAAKIKKALPK